MDFRYEDALNGGYGGYVSTITMGDCSKAEKAYLMYKDKKGHLYEKDPQKRPTFHHFCALFFSGSYDWDDAFEYTDFPYRIPDIFSCTNKNVAERLFKFLSPLKYHNEFEQTYMYLELHGKDVYVFGGDY